MRRAPGIALVLVVWSLALISAVVALAGLIGRGDAREAAALAAGAEARQLAAAAVQLALAERFGLSPGPDAIVRLRDPEPGLRRYRWGDAVLTTRRRDAGGRIDPARAPEALIRAGLAAAGLAEAERAALADAILDWRDRDDEPRPEGAEAADYRRRGLPGRPANRPFRDLEELRSVAGITPERFSALADCFAVASGARGIDPAAASPALLAALPNIEAGDLATLLAYRDAMLGDDEAARRAAPLPPAPSVAPYLRRGFGAFELIAGAARLPTGARAGLEVAVRIGNDPGRPFGVIARRPLIPSGDGEATAIRDCGHGG